MVVNERKQRTEAYQMIGKHMKTLMGIEGQNQLSVIVWNLAQVTGETPKSIRNIIMEHYIKPGFFDHDEGSDTIIAKVRDDTT